MADEQPAEEIVWGQGLEPEELEQMRQTEAVFVSRVWARPYGPNVRIALGEVIEGRTHWHSAIVVPAHELVSIAGFLLSQAQWTVDWLSKQYAEAAKAAAEADRARPEQGDAEQGN